MYTSLSVQRWHVYLRTTEHIFRVRPVRGSHDSIMVAAGAAVRARRWAGLISMTGLRVQPLPLPQASPAHADDRNNSGGGGQWQWTARPDARVEVGPEILSLAGGGGAAIELRRGIQSSSATAGVAQFSGDHFYRPVTAPQACRTARAQIDVVFLSF